MTRFFELVLRESPNGYIPKSSLLKLFNIASVPITWPRIGKVYFEKKNIYPPWAINKKISLVLPLLGPEANLKKAEQNIVAILTSKID